MNVSLQIIPGEGKCNHVTFFFSAEGKKPLFITMTKSELKELVSIDSLDEAKDLLFGQVRDIIVSNTQAALPELKTILESRVYKL